MYDYKIKVKPGQVDEEPGARSARSGKIKIREAIPCVSIEINKLNSGK